MNAHSARFVRGWTAALFATTVAACSHTIGGGAFPLGIAFLLALVLSALVCTALAGKTLSLPRLTVAVLLSQVIFHGLFALLGDAGFGPSSAVPAGHHHAFFGVPAGVAEPAVAGMDLTMLAAHLGAALLTIAAFHRGERVARRFVGILALLLRPLFRLLAALLPAQEVHPRVAARTRLAAFNSRDVFLRLQYRGPPRLLTTH
ncbi:MAG: hypothetical protein IIZ13_02400 [Renibacterium sp.]|nr:hypothetical protein [Renibacterium sp.]